MPATIPAEPLGITPAWLTHILRDTGAIQYAVVTHVNARVIGVEQGFTGVVARLHVNYDAPEPDAPATLIAKFPLAQRASDSSYSAAQAADPAQTRRFQERCAREKAFYRLLAADVGLFAVAPRCYAALVDLDAGRLLLLLEDLAGGEAGDALSGCTLGQARAVIDAIATVHARWWQRPELSESGWLPRWASDPSASAARYRAQLGPVLERYGARIPPAVRDLALTLAGGNRYAAVLEGLNGPPTTLIHADLHLDNVLFAAGATPGARIIDWQSVARGVGALDFALFVTGALSVADRRASEAELLDDYRQLLHDAGVTGYSAARLLDDYRLTLLWQLAGNIGWLARVDMATLAGRERALVEAIFEPGRLFAALEDHHDALLARLATLDGNGRAI
jgi:aminoglycoside phosphotransferase (APT) family kinase protein